VQCLGPAVKAGKKLANNDFSQWLFTR